MMGVRGQSESGQNLGAGFLYWCLIRDDDFFEWGDGGNLIASISATWRYFADDECYATTARAVGRLMLPNNVADLLHLGLVPSSFADLIQTLLPVYRSAWLRKISSKASLPKGSENKKPWPDSHLNALI